MALKIIVGLVILFLTNYLISQAGCTDPQALNYDPSAIENDGSCVYGSTTYSPELVNELTGVLTENSGLIYLNDSIYTINDGGNGREIYVLSQNGLLARNIHVNSSQNIDWEAITESENEIFIGDFGNNSGNRTNLKIYRLNKNELAQNDSVNAISLSFLYPDQLNFVNTANDHNFDCEAFIYYRDSLHLFTKGWENLYTKHYVIPLNSTDTISAILKDSMWVDGLITDATIDSVSGRLALLGYKNNGSNFYTGFVYLLFNYPEQNFFQGNKRRIEIGNMLTLSQTEGISWKDDTSGFISSEKITSSIITIPPKLFRFDFTTFLENPNLNITETEKFEFEVFPNPSHDLLNLSWKFTELEILNMDGSLAATISFTKESDCIVLSRLPLKKGNYYYIQDVRQKKSVKFLYN
jgi:hypothetical protein